jgi:hypothetical protein
MVAVAAAYNASSDAVQINERFFRAVQSARVATNRLVAAARTADACQVGADSAQKLGSVSDSTLKVITPEGTFVTYAYSATDRTLTLTRSDIAGAPVYVVARDVSNAVFTADIEKHPQTGLLRTTRVTLELTVNVQGQQLRLSGSAVPRRTMSY